jgi:HlyD family secretion protein
VKEGQRVTFSVDAFPNDVFEGSVTQVRQQATTESNVVTYEVVISAPNNDLKLKPGLTANVTIFTLELNDVLAVPSKALRFTPNEAMLNEGETITDVEGRQKLWVKEGPNIKAIAVETGMSNGALTQITRGASDGLEVLTDVQSGEEPNLEEASGGNPFMPRPRNRNAGNNRQGGNQNRN